jgi:bacterioferritin
MYAQSIELLNKAVADEMSAVHQYMYFHFHCDDQGYDLLASLFLKTAMEEMRHIELIAERILFLNGAVIMKASRDVEAINEVREMIEFSRSDEMAAIKNYNVWANECAANADSASKKLFENLVMDEERHFDQFDTEMDNLDRFGDNYLALQSIERSKTISAPGTAPAV